MNVKAIGYQDRAEFRDTRRNLRNTLVSDLNHHGVANAHEDTSPSVPACSFLGSAALERKGLLATTSTGAPAVREHGGGRAHRALLTQQPSGRPARSTGGEIKSLCCAAAGIIALATRPCGARAYPLTGVRRAAHPAAALRSTPRPHAQPVKGYRSPFDVKLNKPGAMFRQLRKVFLEAFMCRLKLINKLDSGYLIDTLFQEGDQDRKIEAELPSNDVALRIEVIIQVVHRSLHNPLVEAHISNQDQGGLSRLLPIKWLCAGKDFEQLFVKLILLRPRSELHGSLRSFPNKHVKPSGMCKVSLRIRRSPQILSLLLRMVGDGNSNQDRHHRTDCLNPSSSLVYSTESIKYNEKRPTYSSHRQEGPDRPQTRQLHVVRHPKPLHVARILVAVEAPSLQAPCHHVQRGAA